MSQTIRIAPVTRIEGHLDVELTVDAVQGRMEVVDAKCQGTMFRGFEMLMKGRDPRDATHYTQRICGVCPTAHGMASSKVLESAFNVAPTDNGRIMRNFILGANYLQSHILHFYHLAAPDYIDTTGILDMSPWTPRYTSDDMASGELAQTLVGHYVLALSMRRKAHQLGAIFGGKLPCAPSMVPGGCSSRLTTQMVAQCRPLLAELRDFIDNIMVTEAAAVAELFPAYLNIGRGHGNLLAFGVFDLDAQGNNKLLRRGRSTDGQDLDVNTASIREYVAYSRYTAASGNRTPASGITEPMYDKAEAYSWLKAPRYDNRPHEVGPLARMWVNGDYRRGIGVTHRLLARSLEAKKVADAMSDWLDQLRPGQPTYQHAGTPATASGEGLTEAARGALGHWLQISNGRISSYQFVSPTTWNCSPKDDLGQHGAMEQAMIGTPVANMEQPIEVLRVIHSFDPCLACSVHLVRPGRKTPEIVLDPQVVNG
jgi:hydrogenase large subunit